MNAQQLKNAILQEAIEGRLVPHDSNDEPASALLARIRKEKERLVKEGNETVTNCNQLRMPGDWYLTYLPWSMKLSRNF